MNRPDLFAQFADCAKHRRIAFGETIFEEDSSGECLFLIQAGRLRVLREKGGYQQTLGYLFAGDHFGEGALMTGNGHRATIRASESTEILEIPKRDFFQAIASNSQLRTYFEIQVRNISYRNFTRDIKVEMGRDIGEEMQFLFQSLKYETLTQESVIVTQGEIGRYFYFIGSGTFHSLVQDGFEEKVIHDLGPGDFFGAQALISGEGQEATIKAVTDAEVFTLTNHNFKAAIQKVHSLENILSSPSANQGRKNRVRPSVLNLRQINGQQKATDVSTTGQDEIEIAKIQRVRKFPFLKQHDASDCGAACLGMICKYYRMPIGLNRLRDMANVSRNGTSLSGLAEAAEKIGFMANGVRTGYEALMRTQLPVIIHWRGNHFVVLFKMTSKYVKIADPAVGIRKLSRKEFEENWTNLALLLDYTKAVSENEPSKSSFRRFIPLIHPYYGVLFEVLLASFMLGLFGLAAPIFTQVIVDQVLVHQDRDLLNLMLFGMIVITVFQLGTTALRTYLIGYISVRLSISMLSIFYRHLLALPLRFFALRRTGDLTTRFKENATIQRLLTDTTISAILDLVMLFVYLGLMFYYNIKLTGVVLVFLPLSVMLTLIYTPILKSISQRAFLARAEQSSVLIDALRGIEVVKIGAIEQQTRWSWEERFTKEMQIGFHRVKMQILFGSGSSLINLLSNVVILWYGATLVMDGELSVGQLMAFNTLIGSVMGPMMGLIGLWPQVQEARIALDRLNDVYDTSQESSRHGDFAVTLDRIDGRVVFDQVSFRYGAGEEVPYVLNNISLKVEPGQTIALVGRSGAGKTSLVKLIPRLFDPTEGQVLLDGLNLKDFDPNWLRKQMGMVLQDSFLLSGTIAENICLGTERIEMERMVEVAQLADAHKFIADLPFGYETRVGEQGVGLSSGQRQRIAIARALYPDPNVLIFDEATNALDTESEMVIQENLEDILKERTTFIIAHRLSTVRNADLIIVLEQGHIVESGKHEDLIVQQGLYSHLVGQQLDIA